MTSLTKMKATHNHGQLLVIVLLTFALASVLIGIGLPKNAASATAAPVKIAQESVGTIDGSVNPEMIPDRIAYLLLFRFVSNRQEGTDKQRIRAYVRQMGLDD